MRATRRDVRPRRTLPTCQFAAYVRSRSFTPADILAHALLHERQHHGVHKLLYQLGIEVPIVEYRSSLPERRT